jgi:hypothetical protein
LLLLLLLLWYVNNSNYYCQAENRARKDVTRMEILALESGATDPSAFVVEEIAGARSADNAGAGADPIVVEGAHENDTSSWTGNFDDDEDDVELDEEERLGLASLTAQMSEGLVLDASLVEQLGVGEKETKRQGPGNTNTTKNKGRKLSAEEEIERMEARVMASVQSKVALLPDDSDDEDSSEGE